MPRFLAAAGPFANETMKLADMILPSALWLETEGTYNGRQLAPVIKPPGGALPYGEILRQLAGAMGQTLPPVTVETVLNSDELTEETIKSLLKECGEEPPEPAVRSTTVKFADGSLTDYMSWNRLQERDAW